MQGNRASLSAVAAATVRAMEAYRPEKERLFEDPITRDLLPPLWQGVVALAHLPGLGAALLAMRERQLPGTIGNLLCRTRFIDDTLRDAIERDIDQVVILGAGFDTRAYRIPGIERTRVFEVDHPAAERLKRTRVQRVLGALPPHVTFVPIDFDRQKLDDEMTAAGFRRGEKTFFVWEGVTQYITAEAVDGTFQHITRTAAIGSQVVFTYIQRGIIDGSIQSEVYRRFVSFTHRQGMAWIFGLDPAEIDEYLAARGLEIVEHVGAAEYQARYLEPLGRPMDVFEGERVVLAQVTGMSVRWGENGTGTSLLYNCT